ncbi:MAG: DUF6152 family protein [Gammaproteobacteria bacterium]
MSTQSKVASIVVTAALVAAVPAWAHHSFSIFDAEQTKTFTGVVTRVNPDANHLQIFFAPMNQERRNVERNAEGKPIVWAVEMAGSAQSAKDGISVNAFPPGTIFSVSLHPLRNGDPAGARAGALYKCPEKTPPAAGKNCETVTGSLTIGGDVPVPAATTN